MVMVAPHTMAEADRMHVQNEHAKHGMAKDWMECAALRCMEARLALGLDLHNCPTCGSSMAGRGRWIHAGAEPKALQSVLAVMLPGFLDQVRQAVLAEIAPTKEKSDGATA